MTDEFDWKVCSIDNTRKYGTHSNPNNAQFHGQFFVTPFLGRDPLVYIVRVDETQKLWFKQKETNFQCTTKCKTFNKCQPGKVNTLKTVYEQLI